LVGRGEVKAREERGSRKGKKRVKGGEGRGGSQKYGEGSKKAPLGKKGGDSWNSTPCGSRGSGNKVEEPSDAQRRDHRTANNEIMAARQHDPRPEFSDSRSK
jgi:hypothetical protein